MSERKRPLEALSVCLQVAFGVPRGGGSKSILADSTVAIGGSSKRQGNSSTFELSAGSDSNPQHHLQHTIMNMKI